MPSGRTAASSALASVTPGPDELLELLPSHESVAAVMDPHLESLAPQAQLPASAVDLLAAQGAVPEDPLAGPTLSEFPEVVLQVAVPLDVAGVGDGPVRLVDPVTFRNGLPGAGRVSALRVPRAILWRLHGPRHLSCLVLLSRNVEGTFAHQYESGLREPLEIGRRLEREGRPVLRPKRHAGSLIRLSETGPTMVLEGP